MAILFELSHRHDGSSPTHKQEQAKTERQRKRCEKCSINHTEANNRKNVKIEIKFIVRRCFLRHSITARMSFLT